MEGKIMKTKALNSCDQLVFTHETGKLLRPRF